LSADLAPLRVNGDGVARPVVSSYLMRTGPDPVFLLRHPLAPCFLAAPKYEEGKSGPAVAFNAPVPSVETAFVFRAAEAADVPHSVAGVAEQIGLTASRPQTAMPILSSLRAQNLNPILCDAFLRLLPVDELDHLTRWIAGHANDRALLAQAMPHDEWLSSMFVQTTKWRDRRESVAGNVLDSPASDDDASRPVWAPSEVPVGQAMVGLLRAQITPRRYMCLVAHVRNQGMYILDWVAYHRALGFDHIFLYSDPSEDDSDPLLDALAAAGVITLIRNTVGNKTKAHIKAYGHALMRLPQILDYRWTMILDIDDYFVFEPNGFHRASDVFAFHETQDVDAIAFNRLIFRVAREQSWNHAGMAWRMSERMDIVDQHVKSAFRSNFFWGSQNHFPYSTMARPFIYRTEKGELHHHPGVHNRIPAFAEKPSADFAWINHYQLRTLPETVWQMQHGRGVGYLDEKALPAFFAKQFLYLADFEHIVKDGRIHRYAEAAKAEVQILSELPGVADAQRTIYQGWAGQLRRAVMQFVENVQPGETEHVVRLREIAREHHIRKN